MPDMTFNTTAGQAIERDLMVAFLNTGASTASPTWAPMGANVNDSAVDYDWQKDSSTDILGTRRSHMKKPQMTQTFSAEGIAADDAALVRVWNLGVKDQDYTALANQDVLIVHKYAGSSGYFAERYTGASVSLTNLGGEGGGNLTAEYEVEYAGTRTTGTATIGAAGAVTFTADGAD